jgi:hypothetical protein
MELLYRIHLLHIQPCFSQRRRFVAGSLCLVVAAPNFLEVGTVTSIGESGGPFTYVGNRNSAGQFFEQTYPRVNLPGNVQIIYVDSGNNGTWQAWARGMFLGYFLDVGYAAAVSEGGTVVITQPGQLNGSTQSDTINATNLTLRTYCCGVLNTYNDYIVDAPCGNGQAPPYCLNASLWAGNTAFKSNKPRA